MVEAGQPFALRRKNDLPYIALDRFETSTGGQAASGTRRGCYIRVVCCGIFYRRAFVGYGALFFTITLVLWTH